MTYANTMENTPFSYVTRLNFSQSNHFFKSRDDTYVHNTRRTKDRTPFRDCHGIAETGVPYLHWQSLSGSGGEGGQSTGTELGRGRSRSPESEDFYCVPLNQTRRTGQFKWAIFFPEHVFIFSSLKQVEGKHG